MRFRFAGFVLDEQARELIGEAGAVELEPRTFDVLAHLVANSDRVVPKEELLDEIWGDRFVSESALSSRIKDARRAVGDDGSAQKLIRTVHRVGFRLVVPVTVEGAEPARSRIGSPWPSARRRRLVGRRTELVDAARRLDRSRAVTITGPGGVGKTALVGQLLEEPDLEVSRHWVCELLNTRDGAAVADVVLAAVGEGQQGDADPLESLLRSLERKEGLLVLDNCEHVSAAAASLVTRLLQRCAGVSVVATSRVPLGVEGESVLVLEPLDHASAVDCFTERAAEAGARVDPDDPAVPELCERLDCLPLALELAAARTRTLAPAQLCALLEDRFALLRDDTSVDPRHRSLHATITWSWQELDPRHQELLARLSVFVGSFSLEDVAVVAMGGADALDALAAMERLVAASLVATVPGPAGRTRFVVLESVREFADANLESADQVRAGHARHFADLAERLDELCQTSQADEALDALSAAWDNLRAAVGYAAELGEAGVGRRIVRAVGPAAELYQSYEVLSWCEMVASGQASDGPEDDIAADALAVQARLLAHRGRYDEAQEMAERARAAHESHATVLGLVWCAYYRGDLDRVVELAGRLGELARSDRGLEHGYAEGFSAVVAVVRQIPELAAATVSPSVARSGVLGELECLTAGFRLCAADPERAAELLEAVVEAALERDHRLLLGAAASTLTQLTLPGRPPEEAMATLCRTLGRYLERGMWVLISADTVMAARLLHDAGDTETACCLLGARRASGYQVGLSELLRVPLEAELSQHLGERFEELAAQGAQWRPPQAAEAALAALGRHLGPDFRTPYGP